MKEIVNIIFGIIGVELAFLGGRENNYWKFSWGIMLAFINFLLLTK